MTTVCLVPNLAEGKCYSGVQGLYSVFAETACTAPDAEVKVGLRADGQDDESLCEQFGSDLGLALAYPDPQRTYCLLSPTG